MKSELEAVVRAKCDRVLKDKVLEMAQLFGTTESVIVRLAVENYVKEKKDRAAIEVTQMLKKRRVSV